jgi:hypothetical protein
MTSIAASSPDVQMRRNDHSKPPDDPVPPPPKICPFCRHNLQHCWECTVCGINYHEVPAEPGALRISSERSAFEEVNR